MENIMDARLTEAAILTQCVAIARGNTIIDNQVDANVARLAAMVLQSRFPDTSSDLRVASEQYFTQHPEEKVSPAEVIRAGWIISLPRLRDMLTRKINGL